GLQGFAAPGATVRPVPSLGVRRPRTATVLALGARSPDRTMQLTSPARMCALMPEREDGDAEWMVPGRGSGPRPGSGGMWRVGSPETRQLGLSPITGNG